MGKIAVFVVFIMLVTSSLLIFSTNNVQASEILYVGGSGSGNYSSIQDAIDNVSNGDTVFVYNGTYNENLIIEKSISLIGENKETTIIDGSGNSNVIYVHMNWVYINGFTLRNSGTTGYCAGIDLHSNYSAIFNNIITNCREGIGVKSNSNQNVIMDNSFIANSVDCIWLYYSNDNTISGNIINSTQIRGILLQGSNYNFIYKNIITSFNQQGIYLEYSDNFNTIVDNTISNTNIGIKILTDSNNNVIYHNNLISNNVQADDNCLNNWDDIRLHEGNYWSDYTGTDLNGDGIGDTPYNISGGGNQDGFPFMYQNGWINLPPGAPTITGPANGVIKQPYNYTFSSIDPDGNDVYYLIQWDGHTDCHWIGPYHSGEEIIINHSWFKTGNYTIKAKAKDSKGAISDWATLDVTMPYSYNIPLQTFLERFFERFPNAFPILRHLLGY